MSMNDIKSLINYSEELLTAIKSQNKIEEALGKLVDYCRIIEQENKNYSPYLVSLVKKILSEIEKIHNHLEDMRYCTQIILEWMGVLENVKDQKEVFKEIMKDYIAPTLKKLGFKRKGINFFMEKEGIIRTVRIESSRWNTFEEVNFTIVLTLYRNKEEQDKGLEINSNRISQLKGKRDSGYKLTPSVDYNKLGGEVKLDIIHYVTTTTYASLLVKQRKALEN